MQCEAKILENLSKKPLLILTITQPALLTCSKSTKKKAEQCVKFVPS